MITTLTQSSSCQTQTAAGGIVLGPPGSGQAVGATEYGGPGDPSSGSVGARGDNLLEHPDTYAELGGLTWQTATSAGRAAVHDAASNHVGKSLGDRLQARLRLRRGTDRLAPPRHRSVVGVRRAPGHPVRERAVVRPGPDRAAAQRRRGQRARAGRLVRRARWSARRRAPRTPPCARRGAPPGFRSPRASVPVCFRTGSPRRRPRRPPRSRGSSPPATRSRGSRTSTGAAMACRCRRSRRAMTARAASSTCSTAGACCR